MIGWIFFSILLAGPVVVLCAWLIEIVIDHRAETIYKPHWFYKPRWLYWPHLRHAHHPLRRD